MVRQIDEIARRQLKDYRSINPGTCFGEQGFNLAIVKAYAVQDEVVNLRIKDGERVVGYKVGCTGAGTMKLFGMKGPIRGTLFDTEMLLSGVILNSRSFCNLAVEAEMAIKVGENGQILSALPVIELHNYVFRAPKKTLSELVANNGLNKGVIFSKQHWDRSPEAYKKMSVLSLEINDKVIDKGDLWPMDGGPLSSLNWLQKHLREHDLKLSAGDVVLVGTALGLYSVRSGDKIDVKVDGKSAVHCTVDTSLEINY